jgi:ERCC4-type nuclease
VRHLDAGDVIVKGKLKSYIIEIKRNFDLIGSMNDGRMWNELAKLKNYEIEDTNDVKRMIIFEGSPDIFAKRYGGSYVKNGEKRTKYLYRSKGELKSILARLNSILEIWKVPIMITADYYQTGLYLSWLDEVCDKEREERTIRVNLKISKDLPPDRQAFEILASLVGSKTAQSIFKRYPTIYKITEVAKDKGMKGFLDIKVGDRRISSSAIQRLVDVFGAEVKVVENEG